MKPWLLLTEHLLIERLFDVLRKRIEHWLNIRSSNIWSNIWSNILTLDEWIKVHTTYVQFNRKYIELWTEQMFHQKFDFVRVPH